jgi:hypothetical protein
MNWATRCRRLGPGGFNRTANRRSPKSQVPAADLLCAVDTFKRAVRGMHYAIGNAFVEIVAANAEGEEEFIDAVR